VQPLEEAVLALERVFSKFYNTVENIKSERDFLEKELSKKEALSDIFLKYKKITVRKLTEIKNIIENEIKIDNTVSFPKEEKKESGLSILMYDDE